MSQRNNRVGQESIVLVLRIQAMQDYSTLHLVGCIRYVLPVIDEVHVRVCAPVSLVG